MLAWFLLLLWAAATGFVVLGLSLGLLLWALHVSRSENWKHLRDLPGPNETIPLRWVVQQHNRASRGRHLVPYNVATMESRVAYFAMAQKDGLYRIYIGSQPTVVIYKAEFVETVINGTLSKSSDYSLLHSWLGNGLLTSNPETRWKEKRRLLTPAFHFRILDEFFQPMNVHSKHLVAKIRDMCQEGPMDVVPLAASCTVGVLLETIMGITAGEREEDSQRFVRASNFLASGMVFRAQTPWLLVDSIFYRTQEGKEYLKNVGTVHWFTKKAIDDRRKYHTRKEATETLNDEVVNGGHKKRLLTFIDILLQMSTDGNESFTDDEIRQEVDTFMFAGHDTTTMAISWCLYMIGLHRETQEKLFEELESVFGSDMDRDITKEDLKQLKYLDCVIKECQRLYPSVPFIGRNITETLTIGEHVIPKGTTVDIFIYGLHRDPEVFSKPEEFNPDRFLTESSKSRHPYAYIPFSAGSRNCIGQRFALMEIKIILGNIIRHFKLNSVDQRDKLRLSVDLVLRSADGINVSFSPR